MDKIIELKPLHHRGQESIALLYDNYSLLNNIVKKLPGAKWSQTNKCWYVPMSKDSYDNICSKLNTTAIIETAGLKKYLERRKQVKATTVEKPAVTHSKPLVATKAWRLSSENLAALEKFVEQLKLKSYSSSTITTYRNEFMQLLQLLKGKPVNELATDELRRYFIYCFEKLHLTENTLHSRINAVYPVGLKK
jgi:hypothetical protein